MVPAIGRAREYGPVCGHVHVLVYARGHDADIDLSVGAEGIDAKVTAHSVVGGGMVWTSAEEVADVDVDVDVDADAGVDADVGDRMCHRRLAAVPADLLP
jgi:hypothetical protein